jgi:hypothetical protein
MNTLQLDKNNGSIITYDRIEITGLWGPQMNAIIRYLASGTSKFHVSDHGIK